MRARDGILNRRRREAPISQSDSTLKPPSCQPVSNPTGLLWTSCAPRRCVIGYLRAVSERTIGEQALNVGLLSPVANMQYG